MENYASFPHSNTTNKQLFVYGLYLQFEQHSIIQDYDNLLYCSIRIIPSQCIAFSGRVNTV